MSNLTPEYYAKSNTEEAHQTALFCWAPLSGIPELRWLHAIPNGGSRGDSVASAKITGGKLKAQGVKSGIWDVFLPVAKGAYHGLYIEMKRPETPTQTPGKLSEVQTEFGTFAKAQGYCMFVCYTWVEAKDALLWYMAQ